MERKRVPVTARFWSKVDRSGDCWLWSGRTDRDGYGRFALTHSKTVAAYRYAYELELGPIPGWLSARSSLPQSGLRSAVAS